MPRPAPRVAPATRATRPASGRLPLFPLPRFDLAIRPPKVPAGSAHPNRGNRTWSVRNGGAMSRILFAVASLSFACAALAADFGGAWNITATIGGNPSAIRCTLVQKGDALTGACKPAQFDP